MAAPVGPQLPQRWLQTSEINRALHEYRRGRLPRKELIKTMAAHREEFFRDDPRDGNLVHALIRRGHTKSLLQVILPQHPAVVLATERLSRNSHINNPPLDLPPRSSSSPPPHGWKEERKQEEEEETVTLLRRAVERRDRAVVDGIVRAIKLVLDRAAEQDDPPGRREALLSTLLRVEDWRLALLEYPSLLDDPAVKAHFDLLPSSPTVVAAIDAADFRAPLAQGETRSLGSAEAFPENFWAENLRRKRLTLFSRDGLRLLSSPRGGQRDGPLSRRPTAVVSSSLSSPSDSTAANPRMFLQHRASTIAEGGAHVYHELGVTETSGVEVEASLVAFPDALRAGDGHSLLRLCCDLYERTGKAWLFEMEAVAVILKHKWDAFGRPLYKLLLGLSLLLAANYSLSSAYCLPLLQSSVEWKRQLGLAWQGLLFVNALPLILQEYWQWHLQGSRAYLRRPANILRLCTLLLLHASVALRFFPQVSDDQGWRSLYHLLSALAALLLWFKLMAFLRGFHETGPLIRMILQIVQDTRYFLVVLAISVVGFGNCLYLIFQEDIEREDAAGTEPSVIRTSYGNLFHTFLTLFAALNSNLDYMPFNASRFKVLASLTFVACILFNTIILLNLLIALMGDSYDRVQENALAQGRYEQALSVLEIEAMLPRRLLHDPRFFPRWIQLLRPKRSPGDAAIAADAETQQWSGRLRQIYKKIEASERRIAGEIDGVGTQLELMERRVLGLPLLSPRSVNPTAAAAAAADTAVPLPTPEGEEGSCLSPPMPPLQQEQPSPSGTNTAGSALATSSARSLATRLSRLEGSVAAMDEKIDRVLRLLAAMAAGPPGGSDMPSEGEGEEGGGSDEDGSAMNAMK